MRVLFVAVVTAGVLATVAVGTARAARGALGDGAAAGLLLGVTLTMYVALLPLTRFYVGMPPVGDEPHYMMVALSLVRDHDLYVEDEYSGSHPQVVAAGPLDPKIHTVRLPGGHLAPLHDLGVPFLVALPLWLGGWRLAMVMMALLAVALALGVYALLRASEIPVAPALAAASAVALALPLAAFGGQVYPEVPAALAVTVAATQLVRKQRQAIASALLIGVALATLPWLHVRYWAVLLPLAATGLLLWRDPRSRVALVAPIAASAAAYVLLIHAVYTRWAISPFVWSNDAPALAHAAPAAALLALAQPWIDPFDGLFLLAPTFILSAAGLMWMARRGHVAERGVVAAVLLYAILIGVHYVHNDSGFSTPGRFMVVVTPLLALGLGEALVRLPRPMSWRLFGAACIPAIVFSFVAFASPGNGRYPPPVGGGPIALISRALHLPHWLLPRFPAPSAATVAWMAVAALLVVVATVVLERGTEQQVSGQRSEASP